MINQVQRNKKTQILMKKKNLKRKKLIKQLKSFSNSRYNLPNHRKKSWKMNKRKNKVMRIVELIIKEAQMNKKAIVMKKMKKRQMMMMVMMMMTMEMMMSDFKIL